MFVKLLLIFFPQKTVIGIAKIVSIISIIYTKTIYY